MNTNDEMTVLHFAQQIGDDDNAVQVGGDFSQQIGKDYARQTAGENSQQIGGFYAEQYGSSSSQQICGNYSRQTCEDSAQQLGGDFVHQIGWHDTRQLAGSCVRQECGENSVIVAGPRSTFKAGLHSVVVRYWYDDHFDIAGYKAALVDGVTVKADTWYKLESGEFVEITGDDIR